MDKVIYKGGRDFVKAESGKKPRIVESFFNNIFIKIILVGVSVFLLYSVYHSIQITGEKVKISERAKEEVDALRLKNLELSLALNSMQSQEYLEVQARDRLNFAGNNEYIFVIPTTLLESAKSSVDTYLYGAGEELKNPTYKVWYEFLRDGV